MIHYLYMATRTNPIAGAERGTHGEHRGININRVVIIGGLALLAAAALYVGHEVSTSIAPTIHHLTQPTPGPGLPIENGPYSHPA